MIVRVEFVEDVWRWKVFVCSSGRCRGLTYRRELGFGFGSSCMVFWTFSGDDGLEYAMKTLTDVSVIHVSCNTLILCLF